MFCDMNDMCDICYPMANKSKKLFSCPCPCCPCVQQKTCTISQLFLQSNFFSFSIYIQFDHFDGYKVSPHFFSFYSICHIPKPALISEVSSKGSSLLPPPRSLCFTCCEFTCMCACLHV